MEAVMIYIVCSIKKDDSNSSMAILSWVYTSSSWYLADIFRNCDDSVFLTSISFGWLAYE